MLVQNLTNAQLWCEPSLVMAYKYFIAVYRYQFCDFRWFWRFNLNRVHFFLISINVSLHSKSTLKNGVQSIYFDDTCISSVYSRTAMAWTEGITTVRRMFLFAQNKLYAKEQNRVCYWAIEMNSEQIRNIKQWTIINQM